VYLKRKNRRYTMKSEEKRESGLGLQPEARLFEQAQAGSRESLNQLMERHEPLVLYAVKRQNLGDLPIQEAVQAGRIGLWHAILGFDAHRGYRFSTYAYPAIVHQVWAAVKTHCVANRKAHALRELQLFLPHWEAAPAARQAQTELNTCLHEMVQGLPARLRRVVVAYYGLGDHNPRVLRQIGLQMGVTRQRVQQLKTEALVWLRHPAHSQELRALLERHSLQEYEWAEELAQRWLRRRAGRHGQA
jgi:RNA polymerase sigma factor (sigma-70 family)